MMSCNNCYAPVLYIPKAHEGLCPPCHSDKVLDRPMGATQDERYEAYRAEAAEKVMRTVGRRRRS